MSEERSGIEGKLDVLVSGQARIETRLGGVETGLGGVETGLKNVDGRLVKVEMIQEEMRDDIRLIAEGHAATQAAIERAVQSVCTYIDQRIKPLEGVVREHLGAS